MNPFTIAIVNLKGGVAKTTTAISLADLFGEQVGKTLLLDLDRQASAMEWAETVSGEGSEIAAAVEQLPADAPPARLARLINEAGQGYEWLIIDSPPGDMDRFEAAVGSCPQVRSVDQDPGEHHCRSEGSRGPCIGWGSRS